jgi:hypothetical protein
VGPKALLDVAVKRKIPSPQQESDPRNTVYRSIRKHVNYFTIKNFLIVQY